MRKLFIQQKKYTGNRISGKNKILFLTVYILVMVKSLGKYMILK